MKSGRLKNKSRYSERALQEDNFMQISFRRFSFRPTTYFSGLSHLIILLSLEKNAIFGIDRYKIYGHTASFAF